MKTNSLNTIVIDNNASTHEAYTEYFNSFESFSLKGIYTNVKDALSDLDNAQPQIIISEVSTTDLGGIEAIRLFLERNKDTKIIMISQDSNFDLVKKAFKNGASGYLSKPLTRERLLHALNSIRDEGAILSNDIAKQMISMFQKKTYAPFSNRENEIVDLLCQGETYKSMAEKLFITPSAVNFHMQNIYLKLNVNSKSEAISKLRELDCA